MHTASSLTGVVQIDEPQNVRLIRVDDDEVSALFIPKLEWH